MRLISRIRAQDFESPSRGIEFRVAQKAGRGVSKVPISIGVPQGVAGGVVEIGVRYWGSDKVKSSGSTKRRVEGPRAKQLQRIERWWTRKARRENKATRFVQAPRERIEDEDDSSLGLVVKLEREKKKKRRREGKEGGRENKVTVNER